MAGTKSFIVLPGAGPLAAAAPAAPPAPLTSIRAGGVDHPVKQVDQAGAHGATLIEMDADAGADLVARQAAAGVRLFENRCYRPMSLRPGDLVPTQPLTPPPSHRAALAAAAPPPGVMRIAFTVTDARSGAPVAGATVMAFLDRAAGKGSTAVTDAQGRCFVPWLRSLPTIAQLWVMPAADRPTDWGHFAAAVPVQDSFALRVEPVAAGYADGARFYYPAPAFDPGAGVTVGVVDTGVAAGAALNVVGGANTVAGEDAGDWGSNGDPHGTHVAGLVGAHGAMRGTAPGVRLRSYRVFGAGGAQASSFAIIKAVAAGVADGCDVLNLSLGVDGDDPPLQEAIRHAVAQGVLVVAAGNNNGGGPVGSPACYPETVGVAAIGRTGAMPGGAQPQAHVTATRGTDPACFFADFSCMGPEVKLSGPGVGIVSTLPDGRYGQLSGTSMAAPLVAGFAAALLARTPALLAAPRDGSRTAALTAALFAAARTLGLSEDREGHGLPG